MSLIARQRSIIPACDVSFDLFRRLIAETYDLPEVSAYKIGAALALQVGLPTLVKEVRSRNPAKILIYDHQKAGTDIPDTAPAFMAALRESGIDAVIIFPLSGPITQSEWTQAAREAGLTAILGGHMTHNGFLRKHGGYIADEAVSEIYSLAASHGVVDYVVPGNQPNAVKAIWKNLESRSIDPVFYAPGFISQGGKIGDMPISHSWHAIVGRALFTDTNVGAIRDAAQGLAAHL